MPHDLLLAKLKAYNLSEEACQVLSQYLTNRKQRVKVSNSYSTWLSIRKGIPQGSIVGPIMFNIFLNDIFSVIKHASLYNYADDNTLCYSDKDVQIVQNVLKSEASIAVVWFRSNYMKANPDKFQAFIMGKSNIEYLTLESEGKEVEIPCESFVKLLGVSFDKDFSFDTHIQEICKKAGRQLNVLHRIGNFLDKEGRMCIFNSFISSHFKYCPLVWHFCNASNTKKIEKLQNRALRFVCQDFNSSYEELLENAKCSTLHEKRIQKLMAEVYKAVHQLSPIL